MKIKLLSALLIPFLIPGTLKAKSVELKPLDPGRSEVKVHLPKGFKKKAKWPLIISMHGFGGSARLQNYYVRLGAHQNKLGFVYAAPNGLKNNEGKRYWNASNFCCDFDDRNIDDVDYIQRLIEQISNSPKVGRIDLSRVFLIGYSNGAFLASKIACSSKVHIAGIVTISGTSDLRDREGELLSADKSLCEHNRAIPMLHVHGTEDETILYEGKDNGSNGSVSALSQVLRWADQNNCVGNLKKIGARVNATNLVRGKETDHLIMENCQAPVEHYRINGGGHIGVLKKKFTKKLVKFLLNDKNF